MNVMGTWSQYDATILLTMAATLFLALPLFITRIHWTRQLLWEMPKKTRFSIHFSQCAGAFILVAVTMFTTATYPHGISFVFEMISPLWILGLGLDSENSANPTVGVFDSGSPLSWTRANVEGRKLRSES